MRTLAPAGAPIALTDLARAATLSMSFVDVGACLRQTIQERFCVRHCFLTSTGRAGMTVLLRALARLAPGRTEVIIPAYTCYSVAASVVKAGLQPRIVDVSPDTLDYDTHELMRTDFRRVLAVVATNLYGLPNDLPTLRAITREHGAYLIDDAAQAMGAKSGGRLSGTWGDVGLFSLDKGKNVCAIDGGLLVADDDRIAESIRQECRALAQPHAGEALSGALKAAVYSVMLRPSLYGIPERIPQLRLGRTVFTTEFPLARPPRPLTSLGVIMLRRLDEYTAARVANATALLEGLRHVPGVRSVDLSRDAAPVYLRLPLLVVDEHVRHQTIGALRAAGMGATGSYPAALADVPELQPFLAGPARSSGAREVASRIVTLPTHPFVSARDVARTIELVARVTRGVPAAGLRAEVRG